MKVNKQNVKERVEQFLDGKTTNAEEQELYQFFSRNDIPKEMKKYKEMFQWYREGMKAPLPIKKHKQSKRLFPILLRISIAAIVVLVCGISLRSYLPNESSKYSCYEGSYIIRNGKKITDLPTIMPILQKTMKEADKKEAYAENVIRNNTNIKDPEREIEKEILKNVPDEESRRIIKEMLNK